jgi:hypothetical protein
MSKELNVSLQIKRGGGGRELDSPRETKPSSEGLQMATHDAREQNAFNYFVLSLSLREF